MQPTPLLLKSHGRADSKAVKEVDELGALGLGLRRRLLALLVLPMCILAIVNTAFDYRIAGGAASQQDVQLQRLAPLLADSLVPLEGSDKTVPVILMAPPVEDFLKERQGLSGYRLSDARGKYIAGDDWIDPVLPGSLDPEFGSTQVAGVTFRIVSLRATSRVGEVIAQIADGSDARQQWWRAVVFKVLVPNLILVVAAFFVVRWAVTRALAPVLDLTHDVQNRSPSDLQSIDPMRSPLEVRPLVEALNRLFDLVNTQAQSQRRFVADSAHQLRTPLAALQSQVEAWAQMGWRQGASSLSLPMEDINKLRDATRRTTQLANQLLALSRVDAQAQTQQPMTWVDLKDLCEEELHLHLDAAASKGVDLGMEARAASVQGLGWLLREAVSNLVDNAIKYTPAGGHVTMRCGVDEQGRSWLEVQDTGPGIPVAERPRVLERFYRSPSALGQGNGLGLAIVEQIARLHAATLTLQDGPDGHGLSVRLEFAVRESSH